MLGESRSETIFRLLEMGLSHAEIGRALGLSSQRIDQIVYPDKHNARSKVAYALRQGALIRPSACERCNGSSGSIQAHHSDYSLPLLVQWLCRGCHEATHSGQPNRKRSVGAQYIALRRALSSKRPSAIKACRICGGIIWRGKDMVTCSASCATRWRDIRGPAAYDPTMRAKAAILRNLYQARTFTARLTYYSSYQVQWATGYIQRFGHLLQGSLTRR